MNVPYKSEKQKEIENVHETIDTDRTTVIEAVIVRIMKARQTFKHGLLMQKVLEQLSSRFKPKIPLIKVSSIVMSFPIYLKHIFIAEMY